MNRFQIFFILSAVLGMKLFTDEHDWGIIDGKQLSIIDYLYITFSNISTVGYGDYLPVTTKSRIIISAIHIVILLNIATYFFNTNEILARFLKIASIETIFLTIFIFFTNKNEWHFNNKEDSNSIGTMIYFIQTTLTTCGYGDIYPTSHKTKILAIFMQMMIIFNII
jgi:hypothetical protein